MQNNNRRAKNRKPDLDGRRSLMKYGIILLSGAALTGGGIYIYDSYHQFDRKSYERTSKIPGNLPRTELSKAPVDISKEEAEAAATQAMQRALSSNFPDPEDPRKRWSPSGEIKVTKYQTDWVIFEPDREYARKIQRLSEKSLKHSTAYFSSPMVGKIDHVFIIPKDTEDMKVPNTKERHVIYLVYQYGKSSNTDALFRYGDRTINFGVSEDETIPAGIMETHYNFRVDADQIRSTESKHAPVFMALNEQPIIIAETPSLEMLHRRLRNYTLSHITSAMNISREPDSSITQDSINKILTQWNYREELFVHGTGKLWLEDYNRDAALGFTPEEIENKIYSANAHVRPFARELRDIGFREGAELYVANPERVFDAYGV